MSGASLYPVSQFIDKMILNSGYSPYGFLLGMGHPNVELALRDLGSWLKNGEGPQSLVEKSPPPFQRRPTDCQTRSRRRRE